MVRDIDFGDGVLYFPITVFDRDDRVDAGATGAIIADRMRFEPGAVFAACGTGEFHALGTAEYRTVVEAAVDAVAGRAPVLGGAGGALGHARECLIAGDAAGVDGYLVMPPYLMTASADGIVAYVADLAARTDRPLIVYHRNTARLTVAAVRRLLDLPNVIGIKDGVGDVAQMHQFVRVAADSAREILFFNGLPTAELSQAAYRAIGVERYSSAAFAMLPAVATAFYRALTAGDQTAQARLIDSFYGPLVRLRDETAGFAVTLIKAGTRLTHDGDGGPARIGTVRPPLCAPTDAQLDRLAQIIDAGRQLVP